MAVYSNVRGSTNSPNRGFLESPTAEQWGVLAAKLKSTAITTAGMTGDRGLIGRATDGTTPTAYTPEKYNTRSPAAPDSSTLFGTWTTNPTVPGAANTIVVVSVVAAREDAYGFPFWQPGRSVAQPLAQDGERLDFRQNPAPAAGETCESNYLAGHRGSPPPPGRFAGRRPRTRGDWVYVRAWKEMTAGADTLPFGLRQITWGAALQLPRNARYVPNEWINLLGEPPAAGPSGDAVGQQRTAGTAGGAKGGAGATAGQQRTAGTATAAKQAAGAASGLARVAGTSSGVKGATAATAGQTRTAGVTAAVKQAAAAQVGEQRTSGLAVRGVPPAGAAVGQLRVAGTSSGVKGATAATAGQQHPAGVTAAVKQAAAAAVGQQRPAGAAAAVKGAAGAAVGQQRTSGLVAFSTVPAAPPPRWVENTTGATGGLVEGGGGTASWTEGATAAGGLVESGGATGGLVESGGGGAGAVEGTGGI